jgi:hypothetical protein
MTDYVSPKDLVQEAVQLAGKKAGLSVRDMLIRGILAGAFLGYATSLVFMVSSQGLPPIVGAILFPVQAVIRALPAVVLWAETEIGAGCVGSSDRQKRAVGTPLISLGPDSLCPAQEKRTMHEPEV